MASHWQPQDALGHWRNGCATVIASCGTWHEDRQDSRWTVNSEGVTRFVIPYYHLLGFDVQPASRSSRTCRNLG